MTPTATVSALRNPTVITTGDAGCLRPVPFRRQPFAGRRWEYRRIFKAQISDGEQIECENYEVGDSGVELFDESGEFIAFVPFAHLLYIGNTEDDGQMVW